MCTKSFSPVKVKVPGERRFAAFDAEAFGVRRVLRREAVVDFAEGAELRLDRRFG
jgi:hypothetical protein